MTVDEKQYDHPSGLLMGWDSKKTPYPVRSPITLDKISP